jgi:hypothetical protein
MGDKSFDGDVFMVGELVDANKVCNTFPLVYYYLEKEVVRLSI